MLKNCLKNIFLILVILLQYQIIGQDNKNFYFENISIPDGLSNTQVWDILQDKYGFLWIATQDGLNRFDGYNFTIYKNDPENPNSLPNNQVQALLIDKNENFIVGTQSGLSIFDRVSGSFTTYYADSNDITSQANNFAEVFEDSKGRIWSGTNRGLYLFNVEEKTLTLAKIKNNENTIPTDGPIFSIMESAAGELIAGYLFHGLIKYNESINLFERITTELENKNPLLNNLIFNNYEDKTGKLWLCTNNGLFTYDPSLATISEIKLFKLETFNNNNSAVTNIYPDENGYLWISTAFHGIYKYDLRTNKFAVLPQSSFPAGVNFRDPFFKFYIDDFGVLWVATFGKGLLKLDFQKEPFRLYEKPGGNSNSTNNLVILSIFKSRTYDDIVWLGTTSGLYKYNLSSKLFKNYNNNPKDDNSLPSNQVNCIVDDGNDGLWVGTNNGLSHYNISDNSFKNYNFNETNNHYSINHDLIRNITHDEYGNLWLATSNGVVKFDTKTKQNIFLRDVGLKTYDEQLLSYIDSLHQSKQYISSILKVGDYQDLSQEFEIEKEKSILVVSVGEGLNGMWDYGFLTGNANDTLFIHKNSTDIYSYLSGNGKNRIYAKVLKLKQGKYQLRYISDDSHSYGKWNTVPPIDSTWWGIQAFEVGESDVGKVTSWISNSENQIYLQGSTISTVKYQKDGTLIIGTDQGFSKYSISQNLIDNYQYPSTIPNTTNTRLINDIIVDGENVIWLATQGGLIRYDQSTTEYNIVYDKDGLPSNYLQSLEEDNYGNLWIGTLNGISKFNRDVENPIFINYDVQDGLQSYTFIQQASFKSENGELFFGGTNGFNAFMSGNINKLLPKINISEIKINNKTVLPTDEDSPLKVGILESKDLVLDYSQNNISFEFNSIHFSRPEKNKNAYMLEGFDNEDWIYTDRKFATYTNLPEGKYVFKVKGSNGDGIWNEEGISINIEVLPPWWRTIWAYLGYGLLFIGIVFGIDRLQRRRLLKRAKETARIREAEVRAQLAEAESERKSKELEEARKLQLSMLPKELPQLPHLDISVYMKTATEVGGDYYDFHIGLDGVLTVVVGDATGHGLNAGTMVTSTKSLFNALAPNPNIIETFHEMTRCLKLMRLEKLSMCMAMLKIAGNKLTMSSAGMPPVYLFRSGTQSVEEHVMKGMPLGTFSEFPYSLKETILETGDTIILMSDGFPELFNKNKEMYGYKNAKSLFEEVGNNEPEEIINKFKDEASNWVDNKDPDDDVTFVVLKVK